MSSWFDVTQIRDGITYPHYPKEVLQLVKYCKGELNPPAELPLFRNQQLGQRLLGARKAGREFAKTEIFIVEIASSLTYRHQDFYLHHELVDQCEKERLVDLPRRVEFGNLWVDISRADDQEIIEDLKSIVEQIGSSNCVLVSHISTRKSSPRSHLSELIKNFADRENIPFVDPSSALETWRENLIVEDEPVISHFSKSGHEIIGRRLAEAIMTTSAFKASSAAKPPLIQTFDNSPERVRAQTAHGLGDMLLGSMKLYEIARHSRRQVFVDWRRHGMREWLNVDKLLDQSLPSIDNIQYVYHHHSDRVFRNSTHVFTNKRPFAPPSFECRDWIFERALPISNEVMDQFSQLLRDLGIESGKYNVRQIRMQDRSLADTNSISASSQDTTQASDRALEVVVNWAESTFDSENEVIISNSDPLKVHLSSLGHLVFSTSGGHIGHPKLSTLSMRDALLDWLLIANSKSITTHSHYPWTSGFALSAAWVGGSEISSKRLPQFG